MAPRGTELGRSVLSAQGDRTLWPALLFVGALLGWGCGDGATHADGGVRDVGAADGRSELDATEPADTSMVDGANEEGDGGSTSDAGTAGCAPDPSGPIGRDAWGGLTGSGLATSCSGYFHLEHPPGAERTWLVDPAGNPLWAVGINTVFRTANADGMEAYLTRTGDVEGAAAIEWDRLSTGAGGTFGYGFNNVGGFSDLNDLDSSVENPIIHHAAYGVVLSEAPPATAEFVLRSGGGRVLGEDDGSHVLGDPFDPRFQAWLEDTWSSRIRPTDPRLMYYWIGNEIGLFDHPLHATPGVRDLRPWIWNPTCPSGSSIDAPQCSTHALGAELRSRYGDIAALNAAWGSGYASFDALLAARPQPGLTGARTCGTECARDLFRFVRTVWARWIEVTTTTVRRLDPNHLVSSPRFHVSDSSDYCFWGIAGCTERFVGGAALPADSADLVWSPWDLFARRGAAGFDLVSLNVYSRPNEPGFERPWFTDGIHRVTDSTGLPVLLSEFGIRARIEGWTNSGGAPSFVAPGTPAEEQARRGEYYGIDLEQFMTFRGVLGASFHRWADRYLPTEQMNMGIVHRDGSRWDGFDTAIRDHNVRIYTDLRAATGW